MDDKIKSDPQIQPVPSSPPPDLVEACPSCGSSMSRQMFRTGSVDHPSKNVQVCPRCGMQH